MSYALQLDEPVQAGVRRIAHEQAERALESLRAAARERDAANDGIHDARKRYKKIRAVLRLVRQDMGEAYHRENHAWRDAGRAISDVRESAVLPLTVRGLRERYGELLSEEPFESLAGDLAERHQAILGNALRDGGPLERVIGVSEAARDRIDTWPLDARGFSLLRPGLRKVYERGRNRMADAYQDPSGPSFHEWRKRAKYLWYQIRMLAPAWGDVLEPWSDAQHDLTDLLGEANDLSDLLRLLRNEPDLVPDDRLVSLLAGVAERRRRELWDEAHPLGARLYAEDPDRFVARMERYWCAARDPVTLSPSP